MDHPVIAAVREFVDDEVRPVAAALEHADAYPHALVARMRELGLFGALVPEPFGGLGLDVTTYARVIEELCRGWMSLAGVINSHTMAALIVLNHGTDAQRQRFLPRFARRRARGSATGAWTGPSGSSTGASRRSPTWSAASRAAASSTGWAVSRPGASTSPRARSASPAPRTPTPGATWPRWGTTPRRPSPTW